MRDEPRATGIGYTLQSTTLVEQVRGTGHDLEPPLASQVAQGTLVEREHLGIVAADDEQRRRLDEGEHALRHVGAPAA